MKSLSAMSIGRLQRPVAAPLRRAGKRPPHALDRELAHDPPLTEAPRKEPLVRLLEQEVRHQSDDADQDNPEDDLAGIQKPLASMIMCPIAAQAPISSATIT